MATVLSRALHKAGVLSSADKRRQRCQSKRLFPTLEQALGARGVSYNGYRPRAYYCQEHQAWHLTRRFWYYNDPSLANKRPA